ncbi:MAG: hypothetical protein KDA28_13900, partial [Phycisphaerales bacterium]|nr:hypothetical protein [Phycisphaerales bacterium]
EQIEMSDLRHLMATGRRLNGENLLAVTRDSGSGTRNAFANGICLDPSFCVGENIGARTVSSSNDRLGPNFQPSNKGGSSRVDSTVVNHRLAIGHTGAERGESNGWLIGNRAEILAVRSDLKGGTTFVRPTLDAVLDGGPDGYNITGPAAISTIGDPRSDSAAVGGWGWDSSEIGPYPGPVQPPRNPNVSAYLNNITRSTAAFVALPGSDDTLFTPGEFLATQYLLVAAADFVPETNPDAGEDCIPLVPNPDFNQALQDFIRNESGNVLGLPEFASYDTSHAGLVPARTDGVGAYTDNGPDGFYRDQAGNLHAYGSALNMRNRIAGDFDGDGARTSADADDMVAAWRDRNGGPAFQSGTDVIIEVIGDFTGDGNFMADDVRYWADGLHMSGSGSLDRAAGFLAVDDAFGGNFFGTTLANGTYDHGDSVADVSNPDAVNARGWNPIGADMVVDDHDIDWVCSNFGDWNDLGDAVAIDLSCDMNGDLVVDTADVDVVLAILETTYGDVNLDGMVDATDEAIVLANQGMTDAGWADGDTDCDGDVDEDDLSVFCQADLNGDTVLDIFDVLGFLGLFDAGDAAADWNGDTVLDIFDVLEFLGDFDAGC